jgi:hypothetical protein
MKRMGVFKLRKKTLGKALSVILQLSFVVSIFMVPLDQVLAAETTIDTTVGATTKQVFNGSQTVFISDQVGYKFYVDSGGQCVYTKTVNAGAAWAAAVQIDSNAGCFGVSVWYDRWTPGDTGSFIHILSMSTAALFYNRLDVTTDTRLLTATPVNAVSNSGQTGTLAAGTNTGSITKGTDGTIYMTTATGLGTADGYVVECTTNCGVTTSWTETGTTPLPSQSFYSILMPLANGNILLINRDVTNDDILSKVWSNGAGTWSGAWTTIDANALEAAGYGSQFSAALNIRTGDVYLAYIDMSTGGAFGGNNDSLKTAVYSGSSWTAKTNVLTNVTATPAALVDVSIGINAYNGDVYVAYEGRTTAATNTTGNVYWKSSTDGMGTWGAQSAAVNAAAGNIFGVGLDMMSDRRLHVSYLRATTIFGDTIAAITPATTVAAVGTQSTQLRASTTAQYIGGSFAIADTATSRTVSSVTVSEAGTVDASVDLKNVKMYYEYDTSAPYDCASETYAGTESQFGSTLTGGFTAANGTATFTGSATINSTQAMCVYTVADVKQTANTKTIDIQITNPLSEVVVSGTVLATPMSTVAITGATTVVDSNLTQTGYHWRNDDGSEAAATQFAGATENTSVNVQQKTPIRLRIGVSNSTGATTSLATNYRLEYAQNPSTCSAVSTWADVNATADAWDMYNSANLTNGSDTTNISVGTGGVTDVGTTFLTPNGGQLDTSSQSGNITLSNTNFTELEYSIKPSASIPDGTNYCFRVTSAGNPLPIYTNYAQATVKTINDFKVQRGVSTIIAGQTTITITAGTDYEAPSSTSTAFIRITNTGLTGAGRSTGAGNSNAADVAAYISNPDNLKTSITFTRAGTLTDTRIGWEIVEYKGVAGGENEIKVRKSEVLTYVSGNTTLNGSTLSNVAVDADVVPFITGQGNPSAARTLYVTALSTAAWDSVNHRVNLTRGLSGTAAPISMAYVEFTGSNWKIQSSSHTYTAAGATETNSITAVNSLARTFIHVQKRASVNTHANFGAEVWLSGIGQVSFLLDAAATTPAGQTSVAWVIENTQTTGTPLVVTRSNGSFNTTGVSPQANAVSIGKTLSDLSNASIFANNRSDTALATWPEPILGVRILNTTQYELWRSDISANINYRTEVVEWPTALRKIEQSYYRLYVDNAAIKPTDPWPAGGTNLGENTEMTATDVPMARTNKIRIRMSVKISAAAQPSGMDAYKLQFGKRTTTCSAISSWNDLGSSGSTTAYWRSVDNAPADGAILSTDPPTGGDLLLSVSTVAGKYLESSPTATNPYTAFPGDQVEYDWVIQDNNAVDKSSYCFRMIQSDGTLFTTYTNYPVLRTVGYEPQVTDWRWYDDETNATPSTARAAEDVSPSNMEFNNAFKLRMVLKEVSGANGVNVKFALQYSEYSDFSQGVSTVTSTTTCSGQQLWCFYDGAGVDSAVIASKVISSADSCVAGVGNGCGTYNEDATPGSTFTQQAYAKTEYEFTLRHAGARSNRVYYFRLWNLTTNELVDVAPTYSAPSLVTEGAALTFSVAGLNKNTSTAGIVTDATTTATSTPFGSVPLATDYEAAQRISISTNATEGYQVLQFASSQMVNTYGDTVAAVTGTNAAPSGWSTGCSSGAAGCFGYHTTDATLYGGSSRFGATDSYAALSTSPQEIMYSSIPVSDVQDMVYKMKITNQQPAGDYATSIAYIATPVH